MRTSLSISESTLKWGSKELFGSKKKNNTLEGESKPSNPKTSTKEK